MYFRRAIINLGKSNVALFHAGPFKIGHPPNSVSINDRSGSTPSESMFVSSIQDLYNVRAFITAFGSTVVLDGGDERRSNRKLRKSLI